MQLGRKEYLERFERVNLCPEKWSMPVARARADELLKEVFDGRSVVAFGRKVCDALGVEFDPFTYNETDGGNILVLPHPSGRNRIWNALGSFDRAREILKLGGIL